MNDPALTIEQNESLRTWSEKRDTLLSNISVLKTKEEKLRKVNIELAASSTVITNEMNQARGRIEELKIKETEMLPLTLREVAALETRKTTLESEITNLGKMVIILTTQKTSLTSDVASALASFEVMKNTTFALDKVVGRVTEVSQDNTVKINALVTNLGASLEEMVKVNQKNVKETNIVIEKMPAMLMEVQKHGLIKNKT